MEARKPELHAVSPPVQHFPRDFSDLDGALKRRQEMEESSSSDSQTHDYDKVAGTRLTLQKEQFRALKCNKGQVHFFFYT